MLQHLQRQLDAVIRTIHVQEGLPERACQVQLIHDNNIIYEVDERIK